MSNRKFIIFKSEDLQGVDPQDFILNVDNVLSFQSFSSTQIVASRGSTDHCRINFKTLELCKLYWDLILEVTNPLERMP